MDDHTPTGSADPMDSGTTPASPTPPPAPSDMGAGAGSAPAAPRRSAPEHARQLVERSVGGDERVRIDVAVGDEAEGLAHALRRVVKRRLDGQLLVMEEL